MTTWTDVPKPTPGTSATISAGTPIGLLLALTYATASTINTEIWVDIVKAVGTNWTDIAKAT